MKNTKFLTSMIILLVLIIVVMAYFQFGKKSTIMNLIPATNIVKVPIMVKEAKQVGSLELLMTYDPTVLKATKVEKGVLANNAMMEFSIDKPGRVWIGIIDAQGMNGNGSIALIHLQAVSKNNENTPLITEKIEAYNSETLLDIITKVSSGSVAPKDHSVTAPIIDFGGE